MRRDLAARTGWQMFVGVPLLGKRLFASTKISPTAPGIGRALDFGDRPLKGANQRRKEAVEGAQMSR